VGLRYKRNDGAEKGKATNAFSRLQTGRGLRGFIMSRLVAFLLMAALMVVLMVPVSMDVFVSVNPTLMLMLVSIMAVSTGLVAMLVLMLVLVVAAHACFTSFPLQFSVNYKH
jgi:uncharacterized RDD family membrane protein YckC